MATTLFASTSRLGLLSPLLVRPPILYSRWISDKRLNLDEDDAASIPKSVPVSTASKLLSSGYAFLDVRTPEEFRAGHPAGAVNIPYMLQTKAEGMSKNPHFEDEVLSSFKKDDQILVGCRSGKRSLMAATDLVSRGFTSVVDLAGGYLAWVQNGLPVSNEEEQAK